MNPTRVTLVAVLLAAGCGGGAKNPQVRITTPANNATVMVGTDGMLPISFTVFDVTLMPPGTCPAGATDCGHVVLSLDLGTASGECQRDGANYQATGGSSPIAADLTACSMVPGIHNVELALENDANPPVTVGSGDVVFLTITGGAQRCDNGFVPGDSVCLGTAAARGCELTNGKLQGYDLGCIPGAQTCRQSGMSEGKQRAGCCPLGVTMFDPQQCM